MSARAPDEATLHAWVDGELAPDAAAAVAQWLAEHPEAAVHAAALQAQRASLQTLHAQVLDEPVPPRLRRALRRLLERLWITLNEEGIEALKQTLADDKAKGMC